MSDQELSGIELIRRERARQIIKEGWTPKHDDTHQKGELAKAAACYALGQTSFFQKCLWPWEKKWWKPKSNIKNLIRAGALIAAEIDRLQRQTKKEASNRAAWVEGISEYD